MLNDLHFPSKKKKKVSKFNKMTATAASPPPLLPLHKVKPMTGKRYLKTSSHNAMMPGILKIH